jgi:hypothetical protein
MSLLKCITRRFTEQVRATFEQPTDDMRVEMDDLRLAGSCHSPTAVETNDSGSPLIKRRLSDGV